MYKEPSSQTTNWLESRYVQSLRQSPERYDLLDILTIESMIRHMQKTRSEASRDQFRSRLAALIASKQTEHDLTEF